MPGGIELPRATVPRLLVSRKHRVQRLLLHFAHRDMKGANQQRTASQRTMGIADASPETIAAYLRPSFAAAPPSMPPVADSLDQFSRNMRTASHGGSRPSTPGGGSIFSRPATPRGQVKPKISAESVFPDQPVGAGNKNNSANNNKLMSRHINHVNAGRDTSIFNTGGSPGASPKKEKLACDAVFPDDNKPSIMDSVLPPSPPRRDNNHAPMPAGRPRGGMDSSNSSFGVGGIGGIGVGGAAPGGGGAIARSGSGSLGGIGGVGMSSGMGALSLSGGGVGGAGRGYMPAAPQPFQGRYSLGAPPQPSMPAYASAMRAMPAAGARSAAGRGESSFRIFG